MGLFYNVHEPKRNCSPSLMNRWFLTSII